MDFKEEKDIREIEFEKKTIKDNFIFGAVMQNPQKCKALLECILKIKIREIRYPELEKTIKKTYWSKGIRLDVYVEDEENTIYNIEMQATNKKELPKRMRYYQGMIDLNVIDKGQDYSRLKQSYVIFICDYDEFGLGRHIYTFENVCKEYPQLTLKDGTIKIVLNTKGTADDVSEDIKELLHFFGGDEPKSDLTRMLDEEVKSVKSSEKWRRDFMLLWERDNDNIELGEYKHLVKQCRKYNLSQVGNVAEALDSNESEIQTILNLIADNPEMDDKEIAQIYINQMD